jgi:hypothetical protein
MPGNWVTDHMPHLREILDCLSDASAVKRVVLAFCAQMGKTEVGLNWIGYVIDHNPRPMLVVLPTLEVRKRWVLQRLDPLITETPCLVEIFGQQTRDAANSQDVKDFPGGLLVLGGANSPASLASMPICYVLCDEVDRFPWEVGKEGDPLGLIDERTKTFPRRKALLVSTPTIKDASRIWEEFLNSDQRYRHVSCPHCGEMQVLKWGNLRWEKDAKTGRVTHAYYVCEHSGCIIEETAKVSMLPRAQWIPHNPGHDVRGYHINGLYAPIGLGFSWLELAQLSSGSMPKATMPSSSALSIPLSESPGKTARSSPIRMNSRPGPNRTPCVPYRTACCESRRGSTRRTTVSPCTSSAGVKGANGGRSITSKSREVLRVMRFGQPSKS